MLSLCISDIHSKYDALTPAVSWQLRLRDRCQVGADIEREGRGRGQWRGLRSHSRPPRHHASQLQGGRQHQDQKGEPETSETAIMQGTV